MTSAGGDQARAYRRVARAGRGASAFAFCLRALLALPYECPVCPAVWRLSVSVAVSLSSVTTFYNYQRKGIRKKKPHLQLSRAAVRPLRNDASSRIALNDLCSWGMRRRLPLFPRSGVRLSWAVYM
ncbi:hypothetical protein V5799_018867 [Amblyomma americanum]|uniref:Uncharacterized protein n=1 Tax=Amblyomma americanum TaxID=6943 RepID=A0AAQ4EY55_AMBAM